MRTGVFFASAAVVAGASAETSVTLVIEATRPIQLSFAVSNLTPGVSSASIKASDGLAIARAVPSFGATEKMKLDTATLPAPGILRAVIAGSPGRCFPRWRATSRP